MPNCSSNPSLVVALSDVHHAGVVDQQVDARMGGAQFVGGLCERSPTTSGRAPARVTTALRLAALMRVFGFLALVEVAYREYDLRALVGQHGRGFVAEAGVRAGDDGDAPGLIRHVGCIPLRCSSSAPIRHAGELLGDGPQPTLDLFVVRVCAGVNDFRIPALLADSAGAVVLGRCCAPGSVAARNVGSAPIVGVLGDAGDQTNWVTCGCRPGMLRSSSVFDGAGVGGHRDRRCAFAA